MSAGVVPRPRSGSGAVISRIHDAHAKARALGLNIERGGDRLDYWLEINDGADCLWHKHGPRVGSLANAAIDVLDEVAAETAAAEQQSCP